MSCRRVESIIDKHQAKDEAFQSKQNTIRKKKFDLSSETTCCRENMKETTSILSSSCHGYSSSAETYMELLTLCYDGKEGTETKGNEVIEKFQCNKKWDFHVQRV